MGHVAAAGSALEQSYVPDLSVSRHWRAQRSRRCGKLILMTRLCECFIFGSYMMQINGWYDRSSTPRRTSLWGQADICLCPGVYVASLSMNMWIFDQILTSGLLSCVIFIRQTGPFRSRDVVCKFPRDCVQKCSNKCSDHSPKKKSYQPT